jgi:hypothetical protein
MVVTDPTHPRYRQEGTLVDVPEEDADGRGIVYVLRFDDGERVAFAVAQVYLARKGGRDEVVR